MKKFILYLIFVLFTLPSFAQKREIKLDSRTLTRGGEYLLIPSTLGKATSVTEMKFRYDFKTTPYTISSTDSIKVITDTPDGEDWFIVVSDSVFVKSEDHITPRVVPRVTYSYSNEIKIDIPQGKLTNGDGDLYVTIEYKLEN